MRLAEGNACKTIRCLGMIYTLLAMDVYALKSNDGTRTFDGCAVHSAEVHIFAREAYDMLKVVSDALVKSLHLVVSDALVKSLHDAVAQHHTALCVTLDSERALGGKIMVVDVVGESM